MAQSERYDVIVVGIGGMGSAIAYHLARRGMKVLGLERYNIPHSQGSSHGVTRIIRLAYCEHPSYVALLRRAYELWRDLQALYGRQLLYITGSIDAGLPEGQVFQGSVRSCKLHGLDHTILTSAELSRRFPGYHLPPEIMAVLQPEGGLLIPELCVVAHVTMAQKHGADIRAREQVTHWEASGGRARVRTDRGSYEAEKLVISAGPWLAKLVDSAARIVNPERQALAWFQPLRPDLFLPERFPVFNLELDGERYYGLPVFGVPGFKVGKYHHFHQPIDPDDPRREVYPEDERLLRDFVSRYFPEGAGPTMALRACIFTNTPDEHFILDRHPEFPEVLIASPCSGHGFKFCSVVGEIMADLVQNGETQHEISMHRLTRFPAPAAGA
ncbi:MAG TPA: N-methyl-L-tryptophan oxidase [Terriglobia bacterium]|nr:N-methyl-L-tryptophan oxidase [Terriglobia bacterium]